ncbi:MAG: aminoglycoside phosphotransferase family protein [Clostridiales bacterium]|nr:aminoglycoside phosphotransferase family protein [Clostridiales bacterium]
MDRNLYEVSRQFFLEGEPVALVPFSNGYINDTWHLTCRNGEGEAHYVLQKVNRHVFKNPEELMENISRVTAWLKRKIRENGGDEQREALNFIQTRDGQYFYIDADGECWRVYVYIDHVRCYDEEKDPEIFYQSAVAFGRFQCLLSDYPADTLHETIPDFHNTVDRFHKFEAAVEADACGRAAGVQEEISFILQREKLAHVLCDLQAQGELPLRVTHNDTKLNNVMIDDTNGKAICVIDLDTVMPGLSVNDFGDSIRFGASTASEDERDLGRVSCSMELYEAYVRGYLESCGAILTEMELAMLPMGAVLMTFESGIRFLTDYLEGDHYFKISREAHNLDRARTQLKLVADMEEKLPQMRAIVEKYSGRMCAPLD